MLDASMRRIIDPPLNCTAQGLARWGLSANAITLAGFLVGMGAWAALAYRAYLVALGLIFLNRLADGLDGALARRTGLTDLGGYLDIVLDFLFYGGFPFFFAVGAPEHALPAAFLIFSFVGTGTTFLAHASIAAKRGMTTQVRGLKSIYYLGGLTEGTETIAVLGFMCVLPKYFAWLAWTFGALCCLTTLSRLASAVHAFADTPSQAHPEQPGTAQTS